MRPAVRPVVRSGSRSPLGSGRLAAGRARLTGRHSVQRGGHTRRCRWRHGARRRPQPVDEGSNHVRPDQSTVMLLALLPRVGEQDPHTPATGADPGQELDGVAVHHADVGNRSFIDGLEHRDHSGVCTSTPRGLLRTAPSGPSTRRARTRCRAHGGVRSEQAVEPDHGPSGSRLHSGSNRWYISTPPRPKVPGGVAESCRAYGGGPLTTPIPTPPPPPATVAVAWTDSDFRSSPR